ncbi:MAG: hypothetical protein ACFB8W_16390 [Elainellaceae cyanobacterium]
MGAMPAARMAGMGGISFVVFLGGGWLPVVPAALAIALTGLGIGAIRARRLSSFPSLRPPASVPR